MPSDPTEPVSANNRSVSEHMTGKALFPAPPVPLSNFSAYSSPTALHLDPVVKSKEMRAFGRCLTLRSLYFQNSRVSVNWPKVSRKEKSGTPGSQNLTEI